ncbi:hypothetical protein [Blautia faecis]|uniref:hypothetical protein n=1 Tax=Blautia faecis TaxID=871665 RepID=UPI00210AE84E|nr:hypothetical protein [Blautia faecis]MCQ4934124.1 hypothetical protein [Blautia faecis]
MKVNIYLETDKQCQARVQRRYGYVIEAVYAGRTETREGFGNSSSTYHQCNLQALIEALSRFRSTCEICIYRTMCCRMLVEEGHEEFRKINCKYTKVNLNTEKFPEDKDGKVEQLINKLGIIQANRFREKSDWEKMQEALITEEVIKELRDLVDLQGTRSAMYQQNV